MSWVLGTFRRAELLPGGRGKGSWAGSPCCFFPCGALRIGLFPSPGSGNASLQECGAAPVAAGPASPPRSGGYVRGGAALRLPASEPHVVPPPQARSRCADGPAPRPGPRRSGQPHGHSARLGRGRSAGAWKRAPSQCASTIVLTPRHMVPSKNSEKKPHSRCCKGRKLARDSQACKMPAPPSLRGEPASGELAGAGSVHARTVPRP